MAGRIKHAERSHKTCNKNYSEFRNFRIKAISAQDQKQQRKSALVRLANLFKHQDR